MISRSKQSFKSVGFESGSAVLTGSDWLSVRRRRELWVPSGREQVNYLPQSVRRIVGDILPHTPFYSVLVCFVLGDRRVSTMTRDPLKSAISLGDVGETSLALPSDGDSHSGQRRVLEQVTSMRRTKSKYNSRGSGGTLSPTSKSSHSHILPLVITLYTPGSQPYTTARTCHGAVLNSLQTPIDSGGVNSEVSACGRPVNTQRSLRRSGQDKWPSWAH